MTAPPHARTLAGASCHTPGTDIGSNTILKGSRSEITMTLRQVEIFLAIARERSFTRAAQRMRLSQPTLSERMKELEDELGVRLFLRRARQVVLTEAGRVFEPRAARVLATLEDARQSVRDDSLASGSLLIG